MICLCGAADSRLTYASPSPVVPGDSFVSEIVILGVSAGSSRVRPRYDVQIAQYHILPPLGGGGVEPYFQASPRSETCYANILREPTHNVCSLLCSALPCFALLCFVPQL